MEPWILEEWTKGKQIVMGPNPNYTGKEKPFLERFIFTYGDKNQEFGKSEHISPPRASIPNFLNKDGKL